MGIFGLVVQMSSIVHLLSAVSDISIEPSIKFSNEKNSKKIKTWHISDKKASLYSQLWQIRKYSKMRNVY